MVEWIELAEKKPRHGTRCLISNGIIVTAAVADKKSFAGIFWEQASVKGYDRDWTFDADKITHWAELPKPPKKRRAK